MCVCMLHTPWPFYTIQCRIDTSLCLHTYTKTTKQHRHPTPHVFFLHTPSPCSHTSKGNKIFLITHTRQKVCIYMYHYMPSPLASTKSENQNWKFRLEHQHVWHPSLKITVDLLSWICYYFKLRHCSNLYTKTLFFCTTETLFKFKHTNTQDVLYMHVCTNTRMRTRTYTYTHTMTYHCLLWQVLLLYMFYFHTVHL